MSYKADDLVTVIFRFDQKLKDAVNMNTTGTYRVLCLAETMKKLQVILTTAI